VRVEVRSRAGSQARCDQYRYRHGAGNALSR